MRWRSGAGPRPATWRRVDPATAIDEHIYRLRGAACSRRVEYPRCGVDRDADVRRQWCASGRPAVPWRRQVHDAVEPRGQTRPAVLLREIPDDRPSDVPDERLTPGPDNGECVDAALSQRAQQVTGRSSQCHP